MSFEPYTAPVITSRTVSGSPVPHTRIDGEFDGTDVGFTIYLPPAEEWRGRFYQYTYPMPIPGVWEGPEATDRAVGFALGHGGYAVQAGSATGTVLGHAHAAAAAEFAREVAAEFYGCPGRRIHGYLYGPSGGSFQTVGAMELTDGVWDGFVPMVLGTPVSIPGNFFIRAMARMVLAGKAEQIAEAVRPGGSGDPFAGLDAAESAVLREMLDFGTPLCAWQHPQYLLGFVDIEDAPASDSLLDMGGVVRQLDPTYADDFWSLDGYLGTEQSPLGDRVRAELAALGDTPENRWQVALPSYYRHQVPTAGPDMYGFDQFRDADGTPRYPQRPIEIGPIMQQQTTGGATYSGAFSGKVIVVDTLGDADALPWHADWYARRVRRHLGEAESEQRFRLYYHEASDHHEQRVTGFRATHLVDYIGAVEQALVDVTTWVEDDVPAPPSTVYRVDGAQIEVSPSAGERQGIQPVATLKVAGDSTGSEVGLHLSAEAPVGSIVEVAWDLDGTGRFQVDDLASPAPQIEVEKLFSFDTRGRRLVAARITSQRPEAVGTPYCRVQNMVRLAVDVA